MHIYEILAWFKRAVPEPTSKNQAVQIGCHLEEVGEMGTALGDLTLENDMYHAASDYKGARSLGQILPSTVDIERRELLDALCDQIVTAVGIAHMFNLDIISGLTEVNRSNWSKFVDGQPQFDANGKIAKSANYTPPNLEGMY